MPPTDDRDPPRRPGRRPLGAGPGARPSPLPVPGPVPAPDPARDPAPGTADAPPGPALPDAAPRPAGEPSPPAPEPAPPAEPPPAPEPAPPAEPGAGSGPPSAPVPDAGEAPPARERAGQDDDGARPAPVPASAEQDAGGASPSGDAAGEAREGTGEAAVEGTGEGAEEGDGRFTVRLANFEGPFDLLLQLIAKHKLDVTEVALSRVTDDFMAHIRAMGPDWDLDQTTEFLVVAATLLDLKAARLLPAAEVEDEADLALLEARDLLFARLLQYRAYKRIADIFGERLVTEARRHPRTVGLEPHHAELLPDVVISIGAEGFARLAVKAMQPRAKPQVYVDHIHAPLVSVREQAGIVIARLRAAGAATFLELTEDTDDTLTVVARFLALLELYRERAVELDQEEALGSLLVRWTGARDGDGERPLVTDEFDQEPGTPADEKTGTAGQKETA
ncbi:segregation and condensation protein A [Streptomyces xinghaiensis]|uniref:Segregation and condensation protein A n=1 Tax=Streptomyces xinghaiensis TaxID=1038928 RepID=A0A420V4M6_9ACTN|nr:segregation/condensation protein A [Streptomyces xinghaiensis]PQM20029.1 segregation/condensation protein A [Streptomyces xinghaiensis]RKM96371.1 segregation/condensation protein A [Streptomyces xinghaiensis]RNC74478.1 segregation/condensation protein A [Streptomyces xinghaiensis]